MLPYEPTYEDPAPQMWEFFDDLKSALSKDEFEAVKEFLENDGNGELPQHIKYKLKIALRDYWYV